MKWYRIKAFIYRHWLEIKASLDRKADIFFFPVIDVLVFGFLSSYVASGQGRAGLAASILAGIVFWSVLYNIQRDLSFSLLDDVWSRNIFNLYASPLQLREVIVGTLLLSVTKAFLTTTVTVLLVTQVFHLPLFSLGASLAIYLLELFVFGWAFGFFTSGIILRFGTRAQAVSWSLILVLYPFTGALYPLSVLPELMSAAARLIPASYIFEAVRGFFLSGQALSFQSVVLMTGLNLVYLMAAIIFYVRGHKSAKDRGWFVHPT